jgi:hypothetical protein
MAGRFTYYVARGERKSERRFEVGRTYVHYRCTGFHCLAGAIYFYLPGKRQELKSLDVSSFDTRD